ncbi:hypothetical protein BC939DRAFT_440718 [Gamsiella multidivaricata]|uniref:uncharacterized protein n=1 Tax=Gamsiella multidivaricata TaxID=101098 RepID=UPI00221F1140|nr:uncharacterized protein BC939DRAFT_440718 [Gamsiella multidivaricata]KAI7829818.1 hypothetical protein BC939DRAFT_440718 [Gamsiella multidivaricata]
MSFRKIFAVIIVLFTLMILSISEAAPVPVPAPVEITLDQLEAAFVGQCPNATQGEVISCSDALPYINDAIKKYGLATRGQRAAYIATMAYEGAYLRYDHNLVIHSQGTRSILPASSLRIFIDANKPIQNLWQPSFPKQVNNDTIVDILIENHADFEPGAWWTVHGPGCAEVASNLSESLSSFVDWETTCINGGIDTVDARAGIYNNVYAFIV